MLTKAAFTTLVLVVVSSEASAIERYTSTSMTCARLQAVIKRDGAAIVRFTGSAGVPIYGKAVRNQSYCDLGEAMQSRSIPTSDTRSCRVYRCIRSVPAGRD
ncbi:hypothetical protein [Arvimicrobium flavum]|uniref:hypothetical protein n=1 Tax=Arvimicrobium flavum TaxID=3393320 RepID=UPI00237B8C3A|nr:hypothetical protein [Mesorhizobium shangrilense]